ncbi:MAG: FHA domain-containing serine/threonine-protein kinase [Planctomycetota bacterium]
MIIDKDRKGEDVKTLIPGDRPMTIGRGAASSLRIRDAKMSRVHCELTVAGGVTTVKDLNSMNGTLVNGKRVTAATLADGDIVLAGYTQFRYVADEAGEAAKDGIPAFKPLPKPRPARGARGATAAGGRTPAPRRPAVSGPARKRTDGASRARKPPRRSQGTDTTAGGTKPSDAQDAAGIVARFNITCDGPGRALNKGEIQCCCCRRLVAAKEVKTGKATNIHGQVCCPECLAGDPLLGKTVAGYRIDAKLGTGAWSSTYKAEQLSMARSVVFRAIRAELMADPELSAQFLAAVKRGGQISHPNLIRMYDIGRTAKRCYASVEYIDGESVRQLLTKKPGFAVEEAVQIIIEVARAVDVAHRRNVLHRDIRPANIILNEERIPKLAGLGFAKIIEDAAAAGAIKIQHATDIVRYWAPECLTEPKRAGKRADVYSLAATLYAMLARRPPFDEHRPAELVAMIRDAWPAPLDSIRSDVPRRLAAIVAKAMAKNPTDRYPGCQFFIRDLRKARSALS